MYCTLQDLVDAFGRDTIQQLTDRADPPVGAIDETVAERAIRDASETIDAYLSGQYSLPFAVVPGPLRRVACDLAHYYLFAGTEVPDGVRQRYEDAERFLAAVSQGKVKLGATVDGPAPQTNDTATMESGGRVFGRDGSHGFV